MHSRFVFAPPTQYLPVEKTHGIPDNLSQAMQHAGIHVGASIPRWSPCQRAVHVDEASFAIPTPNAPSAAPRDEALQTKGEASQRAKSNAQISLKQAGIDWACTTFGTQDLWKEEHTSFPPFAIFDMDSTLLLDETLDAIADQFHLLGRFHEITESAMQGKIDFTDSLHDRLILMEGIKLSDIAIRIRFATGAGTLIKTLQKAGVDVWIASGGFRAVAEQVAAKLGIKSVAASDWGVRSGQLTGRLRGDMVTGATKGDLFSELLERHRRAPPSKEHGANMGLAVGDGGNDVEMLGAAAQNNGLGVCFYHDLSLPARPVVEASANGWLNGGDLRHVLYMLGIPQSAWVETPMQDFVLTPL
ncbi:MAG: HAD-IB family phosphatase [Alphaproteobacteria bacterium]|nr:HAD-IB family phosphatase [Alphaproteobacteria bacterium]